MNLTKITVETLVYAPLKKFGSIGQTRNTLPNGILRLMIGIAQKRKTTS